MSDEKTLSAYDKDAKIYAQTWLRQPLPSEIYESVEKYFIKGQSTADIGSGSGRDVSWLNQNSYPCIGFDASESLLHEAKALFPNYVFLKASLPMLLEISDQSFSNVLCETVLMHLKATDVPLAIANLLRITKTDGVLSLSWRLSDSLSERESDGRLYTPLVKENVMGILIEAGATCLDSTQVRSASTGKIIERVICRRDF